VVNCLPGGAISGLVGLPISVLFGLSGPPLFRSFWGMVFSVLVLLRMCYSNVSKPNFINCVCSGCAYLVVEDLYTRLAAVEDLHEREDQWRLTGLLEPG
jgi:hypothetical protein